MFPSESQRGGFSTSSFLLYAELREEMVSATITFPDFITFLRHVMAQKSDEVRK